MSEMEAEFLRRTGKRLDQSSREEIMAYADKLKAEGEAHRQHAAELRHFHAERLAKAVSNDNGEPAA